MSAVVIGTRFRLPHFGHVWGVTMLIYGKKMQARLFVVCDEAE